jgi:hypothetical protein
MKKYPYKKVICFFTLVPMLGGIFFIIGAFGLACIEVFNKGVLGTGITFFDVLRILIGTPLLLLGCGLFGEIVFIIPAFIFSLIYAGLKLTRQLKSFFIIGLTVIIGIIPFILFSMDEYGHGSIASMPSTIPREMFLIPKLFTLEDLKNMHSGHFIMITLAVISSLIMAWFALPKPEDLEDEPA